MKHSDLRRLNKAFSEFGRNLHGQLNFKWVQTGDLHYLYEKGMEEVRTPGGLYVARTTYERHSFEKIYGDRWVLAKWEAPTPYQRWLDTVGTAFPWPQHGDYHLIDSTMLAEGVEPTEKLTEYTVFMLKRHLEMKYPDHLNEAKRSVEKQQKAEQSTWDDVVDDIGPAFGHVPGRKEHVSFPSVVRH